LLSWQLFQRAPISETGSAYLKTATAAPDFDQLDSRGIPDDYAGKSVTIKEMFIETVTIGNGVDGKVQIFVVAPTPGVSYWSHVLTTSGGGAAGWAAGDVLAAKLAPTCGDLFDNAVTPRIPTEIGGSNTKSVDQFRCTAMAAELVPVNNTFNSYGTICAYRTPMATMVDTEPVDSLTIPTFSDVIVTGASGFATLGGYGQPNNSNAYCAPARDGAYIVSMRGDEEAEFFNIRDSEHVADRHCAFIGPAAVKPGNFLSFTGPMMGWDESHDSIILRVDVPPAVAAQVYLLKIWKSYEYKPTFNSFAWQLAGNSASYDPAALELYRQMARSLPVAVSYRDNPDFWTTILKTVQIGSGLLSSLPGIGGTIAKGVHGVANLLDRPGVTEVETTHSVDGSGKTHVVPKHEARRREDKRRRRALTSASPLTSSEEKKSNIPRSGPIKASHWATVPVLHALPPRAHRPKRVARQRRAVAPQRKQRRKTKQPLTRRRKR
jgi:hypothetical protein